MRRWLLTGTCFLAMVSLSPVSASPGQCSLCPYVYGWQGPLQVGLGWVSDSSPAFGDYRGLDSRGGFPDLSANSRFLDAEGRYLKVRARDLGTDARDLTLRGGQQGQFEARLEYSEIPKIRGLNTLSPFNGIGTTALSLPANWVSSNRTADMSALPGSLRPAELRTDRETLRLGLKWRPAVNWNWSVDAERSRKQGTRPQGAGVVTLNTSHFPVPVDFSTHRLAANLHYLGTRSTVNAGFSGSWFDNANSSVEIQNPFNAIPGTEFLRTSLEPDNRYWQFGLGGSLVPHPGWRLSARISSGRARQDDPLLPWTINPGFSDLPAPRLANGGPQEFSTFNLAGNLSARLNPRLDLRVKFKRDDRNNRTPVQSWTPVITDLVLRPATLNRPYDFDRQQWSSEIRWRAASHLPVRAGYKKRHIDRTLQSVSRTSESTVWLAGSWSRWEIADLQLRLERSDRNATPYQAVIDPGLPENPLMRKFHLAERARDRAEFRVNTSVWPGLDLGLAWTRSRDQYGASVIGLQHSDDSSLSLDASFSPSGAWNIHGFISQERVRARLAGAENFVGGWNAETQDRFLTWGTGASASWSNELHLSVDWLSSDSRGDIRVLANTPDAEFPEIESHLQNLRVQATWPFNDDWMIRARVEHERLRSRDWQQDLAGIANVDAVLTLGLDSPDYSVTVVRMGVEYRY